MPRSAFRAWVTDLAAGGFTGLLIAGIVAVNLVIYAGVERGYEASPADVFEHSVVLGVVVILVLVAGPVLGVVLLRRRRLRRNQAVEAGQ